jgi:glycine/D-amino acid oxidase-like deaminating enzyme
MGAARAIGDCAEVLDDPELSAMIADAEQQHYLEAANDTTRSALFRANALEALMQAYPEQRQRYEKLHAQLKPKAEQIERVSKSELTAADAAPGHTEGVYTVGTASTTDLDNIHALGQAAQRTGAVNTYKTSGLRGQLDLYIGSMLPEDARVVATRSCDAGSRKKFKNAWEVRVFLVVGDRPAATCTIQ